MQSKFKEKVNPSRDYRRWVDETQAGKEHQEAVNRVKEAANNVLDGARERIRDSAAYASRMKQEMERDAAAKEAAGEKSWYNSLKTAINTTTVKVANFFGASTPAAGSTPGDAGKSGGDPKPASGGSGGSDPKAAAYTWAASFATNYSGARGVVGNVAKAVMDMMSSKVAIQEIVERCQEAHARAIAKELGLDVHSIKFSAVEAGKSHRIVAAIEAPNATPAQMRELQQRVNAECPASRMAAASGDFVGEVEYVHVGAEREKEKEKVMYASTEERGPHTRR